jgi:hypothetical protein
VKHLQVKKLVTLSSVATLLALAMMVVAIVVPKPLILVMAMSVGQGIGLLSLALYLLAIVLDLQAGGAAYEAALETNSEAVDEERREQP